MLSGIILALALVAVVHCQASCFKDSRYCHFDQGSKQVTCYGFDSFSELDLSCADLEGQEIGNIFFQLVKPLVLDSTLDLSRVNYIYHNLVFSNLLGFDLDNSPLLKVNPRQKTTFYLLNSVFDFYKSGQMVRDEDCTAENYGQGIFGAFSNVYFYSNNTFPRPACPYVLSFTKLDQMFFSNQDSSNILSFIETADSGVVEAYIREIGFKNATGYLDANMMAPFVNRNVMSIQFYEWNFYGVSDDAFQQMTSLRQVDFWRLDFSTMVKSNVAGWLQHLNEKVSVSKFDTQYLNNILVLGFMENNYVLREDDFCYYKDFPHEKMVVPVFVSMPEKVICDCTTMFLIFQARIFRSSLRRTAIFDCLNDSSFYLNLYICDFDIKIAECEANQGPDAPAPKARLNYRQYIRQMHVYETSTMQRTAQ